MLVNFPVCLDSETFTFLFCILVSSVLVIVYMYIDDFTLCQFITLVPGLSVLRIQVKSMMSTYSGGYGCSTEPIFRKNS